MPAGESAGLAEPLDLSLIEPNDGWSSAVREAAAGWHGSAREANQLLRHLALAKGSKPAKTWLEKASVLVRDQDAVRLLRVLVEAGARYEPPPGFEYLTWPAGALVGDENVDLLRAACWAAGLTGQDWPVACLRTLAGLAINESDQAGWGVSAKVPNASIYALGALATSSSLATLHELRRLITHAAYRTQIDAALAAAAIRGGVSVGELAERAVPDAGLDGAGTRIVSTDSATVRITIGPGWGPVIEWRTPAGWTRKAQADLPAGADKPAKDAAREVKAALAGERTRLEALFAEERSWPLAQWRSRYLAHPVTGSLARQLIWSFEVGPAHHLTAMPSAGDGLRTPSGPCEMPADATVRLWHPARAAAAEVKLWRDYIASAGERQPFKQAFREVYVLTPAELATRLYSNRFAAHILRYHQAYALFKERGWTASYLRRDDPGETARARKNFGAAGLTAMFGQHSAGSDPEAPYVELCGTDQVSFCRTGDRARTPVPLDQVPGAVFSEAMRDVDLFVSVTSIGVDEYWADRAGDPYFAYWQRQSAAELSEAAAIRREVLARITRKLKIAGRLRLTDRHLVVTGHRHTYKIHIGSAGVLVEPGNRYLCIVPRKHSAAASVMLPFEDDQILSVILSKAVLLAADDKITDPDILGQLET